MQFRRTIASLGKTALNSARRRSYDRRYVKEAQRALSTIERDTSQKLSVQHKKLADEYAAEVLGSKSYAPWLYVYTLVRGGFREGWIPDNYFGWVVVPAINKGFGPMTGFKSLTNVILRTEALPDLAYYIDGVLYDRDMSVSGLDWLRKATTHNELFVKSDRTSRGRGITKVSIKELDEALLRRIGNCVIQGGIRQHPELDRIISGPVATIRITTVKEKSGRISMRAAYFRVGRSDASWVLSAHSLRVAIIDKSGYLDAFCYTPDWKRWPKHPDTGFAFANHRIPRFAEAVKLCTGLHGKIPHISIIGWDVAIGEDETVKLIEWNAGHCDIKFSEACTGPCFADLHWERLRDFPAPAASRLSPE